MAIKANTKTISAFFKIDCPRIINIYEFVDPNTLS
jgi:hypothetical protein